MSLVNEMLRDLDERRRDAPTRGLGAEKLVPASETATTSGISRSFRLILAVLVVVALAVILTWVMLSRSNQQSQTLAPVQLQAPAPIQTDVASADITSAVISELEQRLRQLEEQNQALIARQSANIDTSSFVSASNLSGANTSGAAHARTAVQPWQPRNWEAEPEVDVSAGVSAILESTQSAVVETDVLDNVAQQVTTSLAGQRDTQLTAQPGQAASTAADSTQGSTVRSPREPSFADRDRQQVRLALEQWQGGQQLAALQTLDEFTFQFPEAHASRETLAKLLIQQGEAERAQMVIDIGLRIAPTNNEYRKIKARLLINEQNPGEAAQLLSASAPAVAADSEYHDLLATAYLSSGRYADAVMAYQLLLQQDAQVGH